MFEVGKNLSKKTSVSSSNRVIESFGNSINHLVDSPVNKNENNFNFYEFLEDILEHKGSTYLLEIPKVFMGILRIYTPKIPFIKSNHIIVSER